jgi:DNA replication protein DnaC
VNVVNQTIEKLTAMRLSVMTQEYRRQMELPAMTALSFDDRFAMMVDAQWLSRQENKLQRLIKAADLREPSARLEEIDYNPRRKLDKADIARLSDCVWIREGKNLIITGATGTGKTYISSAFGNAACRLGLSVRSFRVNRLLTDLAIGRGDGSYNKLIAAMKKPDLLILDDFGMTPIDTAACRDFLEIIDERYERKAVMITAQLPVSAWHGVFDDATIADAVLDRLVHNSYRIEPKGPTMRREQASESGTDSEKSDDTDN